MNALEVDRPLHETETIVQANWTVVFTMAHAQELTGKYTPAPHCDALLENGLFCQ